MINMASKWHHKNISNKITIFIQFWQLFEMFFWLVWLWWHPININIKFKPMKSFIYIYPKTITYSRMCARLMLMNIIKNVWHLANVIIFVFDNNNWNVMNLTLNFNFFFIHSNLFLTIFINIIYHIFKRSKDILYTCLFLTSKTYNYHLNMLVFIPRITLI
jgi:hypothetical protein